jgi:ribonuclease P protein component
MLAFAFGRKFGNAVERNRARRRLRAAFAQAWDPNVGPTGAFLVAGSRSVLTDDFDRLVADVAGCIRQLRNLDRVEAPGPHVEGALR